MIVRVLALVGEGRVREAGGVWTPCSLRPISYCMIAFRAAVSTVLHVNGIEIVSEVNERRCFSFKNNCTNRAKNLPFIVLVQGEKQGR